MRSGSGSRGLSLCAVMALMVMLAAPPVAAQSQPTPPTVSSDLTSDFKYLANNITADTVDIATSPLRLSQAGELLRNPRFYLVLAGSAAAMGGSFALDQTMRSNLDHMSSSDADLLEGISYASVSTGTGALYAYGLYEHDPKAREYALTAGEGAGLASLFVLAIKAGFGRLRPDQDHHDRDAFFHGGQAFVSGEVAPIFALAPALSEYFNNRWYVAAPIYSLALLDGFGRMGHDAHWFSDVVGAALIGVGTTELLIYLHRYHAEHPSRFQIFPAALPTRSSRTSAARLGVTITYSW